MSLDHVQDENDIREAFKNMVRREDVDEALANLYLSLIGASWSNDQFANYQDAWKMVEQSFAIEPFDWTRGERPKTLL